MTPWGNLRLEEKFPTGTTGLMWQINGYGMGVMGTTWHGAEMMRRRAGLCPVWSLPLYPLEEVERWHQQSTQDCSASLAFRAWLYLQILKSWEPPQQPRKKLTQNRFQFFGMMTNEYLDQIRPVAVSTADWEVLSFSAGRVISAKPAATRPHLNIGAQKKTVFGPAGWLYIGLSLAGSICSTRSKILW